MFSMENGAMITQGKHSGHLPAAPIHTAFGLWRQETRGSNHSHSEVHMVQMPTLQTKHQTCLNPQKAPSVTEQQKHNLWEKRYKPSDFSSALIWLWCKWHTKQFYQWFAATFPQNSAECCCFFSGAWHEIRQRFFSFLFFSQFPKHFLSQNRSLLWSLSADGHGWGSFSRVALSYTVLPRINTVWA